MRKVIPPVVPHNARQKVKEYDYFSQLYGPSSYLSLTSEAGSACHWQQQNCSTWSTLTVGLSLITTAGSTDDLPRPRLSSPGASMWTRLAGLDCTTNSSASCVRAMLHLTTAGTHGTPESDGWTFDGRSKEEDIAVAMRSRRPIHRTPDRQ